MEPDDEPFDYEIIDEDWDDDDYNDIYPDELLEDEY